MINSPPNSEVNIHPHAWDLRLTAFVSSRIVLAGQIYYSCCVSWWGLPAGTGGQLAPRVKEEWQIRGWGRACSSHGESWWPRRQAQHSGLCHACYVAKPRTEETAVSAHSKAMAEGYKENEEESGWIFNLRSHWKYFLCSLSFVLRAVFHLQWNPLNPWQIAYIIIELFQQKALGGEKKSETPPDLWETPRSTLVVFQSND